MKPAWRNPFLSVLLCGVALPMCCLGVDREEDVPAYTLPDPLVTAAGEKVTDPAQWRSTRRAEILDLFATRMYGRAPAAPAALRVTPVETEPGALGGQAERRQFSVNLTGQAGGPEADVLLYLPKGATAPVPVFVTLNFQGNHSIHTDPGIRLPRSYMTDRGAHVQDHRATEAGRGRAASRWPVEFILSRGYALATVYYGDIDPDFDDGFTNGVHGVYRDAGAEGNPPDAWGSVSAWAWGLSRMLDALEQQPGIDAARAAVMGHSRLGKTSLWAGAADERFALVISNDSGCGGAALSKRCFGETVKRIHTSFPHSFCGNFKAYNEREETLPFDQHMLIALIAPRPVYVASAEQDGWADPRGEFLSCVGADPVYRLLGTEGLPTRVMPAVDQPVHGRIGYHIRTGKHDVTRFDWEQYLDFADRHLD